MEGGQGGPLWGRGVRVGGRMRKGWLVASVAELRGSGLARRNHVCPGPRVSKSGKVARRTGAGGG